MRATPSFFKLENSSGLNDCCLNKQYKFISYPVFWLLSQRTIGKLRYMGYIVSVLFYFLFYPIKYNPCFSRSNKPRHEGHMIVKKKLSLFLFVIANQKKSRNSKLLQITFRRSQGHCHSYSPTLSSYTFVYAV